MSIKFTFQDVYRGDEKNWGLSFIDSTNLPIDLSNRTLYFTVKIDKSDLDSQAVLKKSIFIPAGTGLDGNFTFTLLSSETQSIQEGSYHCDFRLSYQSLPTKIFETIEGIIEIEQPVTLLE